MAAPKIDQTVAALRTAEEEAKLTHGKGDDTANRIHCETGISSQNIRKHLRKLKEDGLAHIFCWTTSHPVGPVWVSGAGEDAPKPAPMLGREAHQRQMEGQRKRREAKRDVREPGWAQRATYAHIERVRQTPQSWCSPLMEGA